MKPRVRRRFAVKETHLGFQIAPMIDVVFVILLFFMVAAGTQQKENIHRTSLPSDSGPVTPLVMPDEIRIEIGVDGQVYLNDDPTGNPDQKNLKELASDLKALKKTGDSLGVKLLVTIHSASTVKYERIVDVLDALTRAGITGATFAADGD